MNRCINYSWADPNKLCRRKIFEEDKYFCAHHVPINFREVMEDGCSICRTDGLKITELKVLQCGHIWHRECITKWFKTKYSCPLCRNTI